MWVWSYESSPAVLTIAPPTLTSSGLANAPLCPGSTANANGPAAIDAAPATRFQKAPNLGSDQAEMPAPTMTQSLETIET